MQKNKRCEKIGSVLRRELQGQFKPGTSKKERASSKEPVIASEKTLDSYLKATKSFSEYCKDILGTERISMKQAKDSLNDYVRWCDEIKGHSSQTIHLRVAALCKALKVPMKEVEKPFRDYSNRRRGEGTAVRDGFNEKRAEKALELNKTIGVRRSELGRIKLEDINLNGRNGMIEVYTIGKGGKNNVNVIDPSVDPAGVERLQAAMKEAAEDGRDYLLSKDEMNHDADLHSCRAERARACYAAVVEDMKRNPERRDFYKSEIEYYFAKNGRKVNENLHKNYFCRGNAREVLQAAGKSIVYDRVAVLYVSCTVTNHFRSNVTVQNYLTR